MKFKLRSWISSNVSVILFILFICYPSNKALAQEPAIKWLRGPNIVTLGDNIGQLTYGEEYIFANGDDTRKAMERIGNPPTNKEVGMIIPNKEGANWFVIFEYFNSGYIRDDDRDKIDADALMKSMQRGTEATNKFRKERGIPPVHLTGWHSKPYYDTLTNNLTWTTVIASEGAEDGIENVNHNIRLLGRYGYMSVVLVADRASFASFKPEIDNLVSNFSFKKGKSYAEFVKGDKVAKYGLTALIAGGAGAVAAKAGIFKILAKFAKAIFVAVIAFFAAIRKKISGFFRKSENIPMTNS